MRNKYYLTDYTATNTYNAGSKAVNDANAILQQEGYIPLFLGYGGKRGFLQKNFLFLRSIFVLFFRLRQGDVVFIQYPYYLEDKCWTVAKRIVRKRECRIEILIHDLNSLRYENCQEDDILLLAERVICHTPRMSSILQSMGVDERRIRILYLFDYLTDSNNNYPTTFGNTILFAGNLAKSSFIADLPLITNLHFLLYGLPMVEDRDNIQYEGKFAPNDISSIKGDWGLVWDGDSIESCDGVMGKYLAVNSSHKMSLYIVAQKPLIIWEGSALKDFVLENNIGIAVGSLREIGAKISMLSNEEKQTIQHSLRKFSILLKNGEQLKHLLES